jgi:hypothetical protein
MSLHRGEGGEGRCGETYGEQPEEKEGSDDDRACEPVAWPRVFALARLGWRTEAKKPSKWAKTKAQVAPG